jgi:hypothetical protein
MSMFEIKCPICKATIWVDPSSGKVVDHKTTEQQKVDFSEFMKTQKNRGTDLENMFKKAKEDQTKRKEKLEEDFKRAKEHPEELKGDVESPFGWD